MTEREKMLSQTCKICLSVYL